MLIFYPMTEHRNKIFNSLVDRGNSLVLSDFACFDCEFANCASSVTTDINKRAVASNVLPLRAPGTVNMLIREGAVPAGRIQ